MIMSTTHFASQTGVRLQSAFMKKKSSDELIGIHGDLNSLQSGSYPKYVPQARWMFMMSLAGKCEAYLKKKETKGRNLGKPKHACIDTLATQLATQMWREIYKSDLYGRKATQFDGAATGVPMGRNNPHHGKVKFELALKSKSGPIVNGQSLWNAAEQANIPLTGNDTQDAYVLRSWLKHLARKNELDQHVLDPLEYADSVRRTRYLLTFSQATCSQGATPYDTTRGFTPGEEGAGPFVISEGGEWYAKAGNFANATFHHSSFLSGAPVMLAGTMRVVAGSLKYISNNSGHYAPRIADLLNGAKELRHNLNHAARHDVSILAADFENKYGASQGKYLFPYGTFVNAAGAVANPANYAVYAQFDQLYWRNPTAPRPHHRATVGAQTAEGYPVVFP